MTDSKQYTPPRLDSVCCKQCGARINMHHGAITLTSKRIVEHALRTDPVIVMCGWQCVANYADESLRRMRTVQ
jgi:hypothetical protein